MQRCLHHRSQLIHFLLFSVFFLTIILFPSSHHLSRSFFLSLLFSFFSCHPSFLYYLLSLCRLPRILPGLCRSRFLRLCAMCKARGSAAASECTCFLWHVFILLSVTALPGLRSHLQRQVHQDKASISCMILTGILELLILNKQVAQGNGGLLIG